MTNEIVSKDINPQLTSVIDEARSQSFQARATAVGGGLSTIWWAVRAGLSINPWWSPQRDVDLRNFWKKPDHLSGAVYAMESKMSAIPFTIVPVDQSNKQHVAQAAQLTQKLMGGSEYGEGWVSFYGKWIEDLLTQDNGAFAEIVGPGDPTGPIEGEPLTVAHMDSYRCLGRDTRVLLPTGSSMSIKDIVRNKYNGSVMSLSPDGKLEPRKITGWHETKLGDRYWIHLELEHASRTFGKSERLWLTNDHEVLTRGNVWKRAGELTTNDEIVTSHPSPNEKQMQVIVGSILGDGSIRRISPSFCMTQGTKQEEWLLLKKNALTGFGFTPVRVNKNTLQTESYVSPAFSEMRSEWYPDGKKIVNKQAVEDNFSPLMLATWYGDDGCISNGKWGRPKARLFTNNFSREDVEWLAEFLTSKGIKAQARQTGKDKYSGKKYWFIYVTSDGAEEMFKTIAPYLPECMRYKLPEGSSEFSEKLWELGDSENFIDIVKRISVGSNGEQTTAFCIDVENNHNFVASKMIVHNCQRTGNPEFPVIYRDTDGKSYRLHYTRVLYASQMTSPIAEMFGVGLCAVSRCINVSQTLLDILVYKQEKLGSRPHRSILITQGGLDPHDVSTAFAEAESQMDSARLSRYSKTVIVGSSSIAEADIKEITLANLPDGFNEETSINLGMAAIALAFGVDARELFPASGAGATRADALLQHLKQRGKGPGQIIQTTETRFNHKFLPPHLKMVFDFQDDAEDRQVAEINQIRSTAREIDLLSGSLTERTAREVMLAKGEIDRGQFEEMELMDGRLEDGTTVTALFYSKDKNYSKYLSLGIDDPTDVENNDPTETMKKIRAAKKDVLTQLVNSSSFVEKTYLNRALAALTELEKLYMPPPLPEAPGGATTPKKGVRTADKRLRTINLTNPTVNRDMTPGNQVNNSGKPNPDDKPQ